jgi:hypothetical protein
MNKKRLRSRADAAFDELDDEVAELDSIEAEERADLLRRFKKMKNDPDYQKAKSKPDSVSVSGKTKDVVSSKPDSSSSKTKRYKDSVTKTTTTPTTRNGRKGTETKTVTSGTMTGGKSDNPEMQNASDYFKMNNKYSSLIRTHGLEKVRNTVKGTPDEKMFNTAYPPKKKKK